MKVLKQGEGTKGDSRVRVEITIQIWRVKRRYETRGGWQITKKCCFLSNLTSRKVKVVRDKISRKDTQLTTSELIRYSLHAMTTTNL